MPQNRSPSGEFEIRGEWWLPKKPATRVPGVLYYRPGEWVKLEVDKPLCDPWVDTEPDIQTFSLDLVPVEAVVGTALDGTLCTLLAGAGLGGRDIIAQHLLIGRHFEREADVRFQSAYLALTYLEEWSEHSPFAFPIVALPEGGNDNPYRVDIAYGRRKLLEFQVPSRCCRVEIWSRTAVTHHLYRDVTITHAPFVSIETSAQQSFSWYRRIFLDCTRLFSFLVGSRVYRTKTVCFLQTTGEDVEPTGVELYDQKKSAVVPEEPHPVKMPLPFTRVQPIAEQVFDRWFSGATGLGPVHQLLVETLPPCDLGLESVLLHLTQALEVFSRRSAKETYVDSGDYARYYETMMKALPEEMPAPLKARLRNHLRYGNEYSLKTVVERLIKSLEEPARKALQIENPTEFARRAANTRNTLTHHTPPSGPIASTAREYHDMNRRLRALLYGVLAQSLGFDGPALECCVQNVLHYA